MDSSKRKAINLTVIKRMDPHVIDILDSSSHVVVYDFEPETESWKKKGIEGSLFIFLRDQQPKYGFVVMNRLGVDNLTVTLHQDLEVSVMGDYVIYQDSSSSESKIHGLWMYEVADRSRISQAMISYCQNSPSLKTLNSLQNMIPNFPMSGYPQMAQPLPPFAFQHPPPNVPPMQPHSMAYPNPYTTGTSATDGSLSQGNRVGATIQGSSGNPATVVDPRTAEYLQSRYRIRQLGDIWQVLEGLPPAIPRGNLNEMDFQYRFRFLMQDPAFLSSLYQSYKSS